MSLAEGRRLKRAVEEDLIGLENLSGDEIELISLAESADFADAAAADDAAAANAYFQWEELYSSPQLPQGPLQVDEDFGLTAPPAVSSPAQASASSLVNPGRSSDRDRMSQPVTRRRDTPGSAGKTLVDYNSELDKKIEAIKSQIKNADDELHKYDVASEEFPGESKDLELMRALSDQLRDEGGRSYSNIAAQLAMVQDKDFAPVFDREVNRRVNSARKYFGRMGQIQRAAQGEKAAFRQHRARGRRRSGEKLKILGNELKELLKAKNQIQLDQMRGNTAQQKLLRASLGGSREGAPMALTTLANEARQRLATLGGLRAKLLDTKARIKKGVFDKVASGMGLPTLGSDDPKEQLAWLSAQIPAAEQQLARINKAFMGGATHTRRNVTDLGVGATATGPGGGYDEMFGSGKK